MLIHRVHIKNHSAILGTKKQNNHGVNTRALKYGDNVGNKVRAGLFPNKYEAKYAY